MARREVIDHWEFGFLFGVHVVRGWSDGRRITAPWLWWANGRVGVSRSERAPDRYGTEEVLKLGMPSPAAFEHLEST